MRSVSTFLTFLFFTCTVALHAQHANTPSKRDRSKAANKAMDTTRGAMQLPYTALYSSQFEIGDAKYSAIVLNAWKAYDNNTLDDANEFISDTVTAELPDGTTLKGRADFMNAMKSFRGGFTSAKSEVIAYLPVKSIDRGDDLVFIWGTESDAKSDGTSQKTDLHEVWGFNKDGKVDFFKQFMSQTPKENK